MAFPSSLGSQHRSVTTRLLERAALGLAALLVLGGAYRLVTAGHAPGQLAGAGVKVELDTGHGSGVHIGNGFVLTAAHVAAMKGDIKVETDHHGSTTAELLWLNPVYDVALIRLKKWDDVASATLSCREAAAGEEVYVDGSPLMADFIRSYGHIGASAQQYGPWKSAQITDISVAPGVSGGGVFDASGNVVGIATGLMMLPGEAKAPLGYAFVVPASAICNLMARS